VKAAPFHDPSQQTNPQRALTMARERLAAAHAAEIAQRANVRCVARDAERAWLELTAMQRSLRVSHPEGEVLAADGGPAPGFALGLLVLHYLIHADGHPMADRWVAFRDLPGGLMYDRAVRRRLEPPLVRVFAERLERFHSVARALGGTPLAFGDAAYGFGVLPRVSLAVVLHQGDDEFPAAASVLYDGAAWHYLPTDDLSILAGLLVGALVKAAGAR